MDFNVNNNKIGKALKSIMASLLFGGIGMGIIVCPFMVLPQVIPEKLQEPFVLYGALAFWFICAVGLIYFTGDDHYFPTREEIRAH
jgi:hypothetical protein